MSDVRLKVGGRHYTVSCADGQEENVQRLAAVIDSKLASMGPNLSSNEAKNLLFAALILADELEEAQGTAAQASAPPPTIDTNGVAEKLERLAVSLENAATRLEGSSQTS